MVENLLWERHVDFKVGRIGPTIILKPISDSAKELCNKYLTEGYIGAGENGTLIVTEDHLQKVSRAIVDNGLTIEDM